MKIKSFIIALVLLLISINFVSAQNQNETKVDGDVCYVYVVDVAKARRLERLDFKNRENDPNLKKLASEAEIQFPKFVTEIGEEDLTTKHFRFPGGRLFITASIFYTDESMASYYTGEDSTVESVITGITVSNKPVKNAISYLNNSAASEITYDNFTNMIRTELNLKVLGRFYVVGLECDCAAKRRSKKEEKK